MNQLKHDNHYVPQMYLKNWGDNRNFVWSYRLLVPRNKYPLWKHQAIGSIAFQKDLYTVTGNGNEDDDFERWIESEVETPAQESLAKVVNNVNLTYDDWNRLALFLAAQDLRTPTNYIESTERWGNEMPEFMEKTLRDIVLLLEEHHHDGKPLPQEPSNNQHSLSQLFEVSVTPNAYPKEKMGEIKVEINVGRRLWLENQRNLLSNTSNALNALKKHKWSIVEPANGMSWFTSDHPVLRLNYYADGKYDFKGVWGKEGGYLMMPLSPKHLLYTHIGSDAAERFSFSIEETYMVQKFLAERAYKWIFAHKQMPGIVKLRSRHVDLGDYKYEEEQWKHWHQAQSSAEKSKPDL